MDEANVAFEAIDLYYGQRLILIPCNVQLYISAIMLWNDDIAYAMTPYKLFTLPLGVWPLQKNNIFSLIRSLLCGFSIIAMMIMLFLEVNFADRNNEDASNKVDTLMLICCNILALLKLLLFCVYADNLTRNYSSAVNDYIAIDTEEKRTIMRRHAFMSRMICYSTLFCAYSSSTFFILMPMITRDRDQVNVSKNQASELPMPLTWALGDFQISTSSYFLICMVQYIILMLTCTSNCGNDALFHAITLHICGQMELLKIEFINYNKKSKNIKENFSLLALRHRYLINHAELLADAISFVLLVQMLISCLIISLVGFQFILAMKSHDVTMMTKALSVMCAFLLQLFFYSFVGDYLKCQMEEVAYSIYSCNWYCLPIILMRNVSFIIMRSQQPVQLFAGKFFAVNIKTYMTILKSSLSYLSVLRVMVDA